MGGEGVRRNGRGGGEEEWERGVRRNGRGGGEEEWKGRG